MHDNNNNVETENIITLDNHKIVVKLTITDVTDNNSYDNEKVAY